VRMTRRPGASGDEGSRNHTGINGSKCNGQMQYRM
jgi:hypothetical protein